MQTTKAAADLPRRRVLRWAGAGAVAIALTSCSVRFEGDTPEPAVPEISRAEALRRRTVADSRAIEAALLEAQRSEPGSTGALTPLLTQTEQHLAALGEDRTPGDQATPASATVGTVATAYRVATANLDADLLAAGPRSARLLAAIGVNRRIQWQGLSGLLPDVGAPGPLNVGALTAEDDASVAAWSRALAGEYAAVYAYGVIGARTAGDLRMRVRVRIGAHRARITVLQQHLSAVGADPVQPLAGYVLPELSTDLVAWAIDLEHRSADVYGDAVAACRGEDRRAAAGYVLACEQAARGWGAATQALPGLTYRPETTS